MSPDRVGTDGPSVRPDGGSPDRHQGRRVRSRAFLALVATGAALMLGGVGAVVHQSMAPQVPDVPAAAADTQAGNLVDGSVLTGSQTEPSPTGSPTAGETSPGANPSGANPSGANPSGAASSRTPANGSPTSVPVVAPTVRPTIAGAAPALVAPTAAPPTRGATAAPDTPGQSVAQVPAVAARPIAPAQADAAAAVAIHVPRLGINQSLIALHLLWDRSLSVPKSFSDIGWWAEGPQPGAPGAVIVGAHVSSKSGPGVFFRLREVRAGDLISIDRADGTAAVFQVRGKASFPRDDYPDDIVYRTTGKASVHLITCDGAFDPKIGHHKENLVVFADLVSSGPTKENPA